MFEKNSTVCFLGDSITSNGEWIYEIYDHFKDERLKIFNCGKSGAGVLEMTTTYENCFRHNPDYIIIMLGMNDINRNMYAPDCTLADKEEIKAAALSDYDKNLRRLYDVCKDFCKEVILCSPTAYDDVSNLAEESKMCNCGLQKCTELVKKIAEDKECRFIDFNTPMTALLGKDIFTDEDRIHPNLHGRHIMAQIFLKAVGKIDEVDFEGEYKLENELGELFEVSEILRGIAFSEREADISKALDKRMEVSNRKEIIRKKYEAEKDKEAYVPRMYKIYMENIDYKVDYEALYMEKMIAFLNSK